MRKLLAAALLALALPVALQAQDRLKGMPGYARYTEMVPKYAQAMVSGAITPQ